jgi:probable rRNA maturation factor
LSFSLYVREENEKLPVPIEKLEMVARYAFSKTGREEGDVSLVVCDDPFIEDLNVRYMKKNGPTDVLAFPMREGETLPNQGSMVGDIVISIDTAARQSKTVGHTLAQEFILLFVHGLLHLLGYVHRSRDEKREMEEITQSIVTGVQQVR